jgi:hypothetical protein
MKRLALIALAGFAGFAGCGGGPAATPPEPMATTPPAEPTATAACNHPRVHHTPYPGGDERMSGIPWIEGEPSEIRPVGLLWYWPEAWGRSRKARVFTGGVGPGGVSAKVLWAFLAPSVRGKGDTELVIEARNLDGPGTWRETFAAIGYEGQEGAPSYASIVDLPSPGCWRLTLTSGDLKATIDLPAVRPPQGLAATSANRIGSSSPSTRSR